MMTARTFTTAEADRLLGLADQFLQDWAETAHRHGEAAKECEERAAEWDAIRPLLALAPRCSRLAGRSGHRLGRRLRQRQPRGWRRPRRLVCSMASRSPYGHCRSAASPFASVFSKRLTLRYGRARPGINPEILSFRVSSSRTLPKRTEFLGDPEGLSARPVLSAS